MTFYPNIKSLSAGCWRTLLQLHFLTSTAISIQKEKKKSIIKYKTPISKGISLLEITKPPPQPPGNKSLFFSPSLLILHGETKKKLQRPPIQIPPSLKLLQHHHLHHTIQTPPKKPATRH